MAIRDAYQIWAENQGDDVTALLDLMAEDIEVTTLPDGTDPLTFTKACRDKTQMTEYFHALVGDWLLLRADILEMVRERDVVVVVLTTTWRNRRTDQEFTSPAAHVWRFRDGFACQIKLFFDSAKWSAAARGGGHLPET
ncbi:MAG: nuclear transport factor 2 family protein [Geminicoccaceae bacterium]